MSTAAAALLPREQRDPFWVHMETMLERLCQKVAGVREGAPVCAVLYLPRNEEEFVAMFEAEHRKLDGDQRRLSKWLVGYPYLRDVGAEVKKRAEVIEARAEELRQAWFGYEHAIRPLQPRLKESIWAGLLVARCEALNHLCRWV